MDEKSFTVRYCYPFCLDWYKCSYELTIKHNMFGWNLYIYIYRIKDYILPRTLQAH